VFGDNLERMRASGLVIALASMSARRSAVRRADHRVHCSPPRRPSRPSARPPIAARTPSSTRPGAPIAEVVTSVQAVERTWHRLPTARRDATILALGDRSYPVTVDPGTIDVP